MDKKFRAWHTPSNKFLIPWPNGFSILGETTCFDLIGQQLHEYNPKIPTIEQLNDVVITQWTELKDRNGKEIYEGDILSHYTFEENKRHGSPKDKFSDIIIAGDIINVNENPYPIHLNFRHNPYRLVKYITDDCYKEIGFYSPFTNHKPYEFEIIGNIFEDKNLVVI